MLLDQCDAGRLSLDGQKPVSRGEWLAWLNSEPAEVHLSPEERELRTLLGV